MSDPWLKFYPTDWRSDPALRMCSMAARGLWIEMIALMHEATPYGHLLVSGRSPTDTQLAVLVGAPSDQIPELLGELDAAGVFSRTKEGVIYSRKMTRTAKKAAIARKNGKKGGNPSLCNPDDIPASDKGQDKVQVKTQKPEARSQKIDDDDSARADDGLMARACAAAGTEFGSLTGSGGRFGMAPKEVDALRRWQQDLGLTPAQIIASITDQASRLRSPPRSLTYFTPGLQQLAAELTAPPLQPAPHEVTYDRPTARDRRQAAADEALRARLYAAARVD